ncbi:contractile injection system tape measure protein [Mucilaginibacter sp. AK015]|uniref:contractile injection system tape measure protein n=1 Tax=Mucilaginibacter sp. AK015 TaxID=2723072 RepID=UPI001611A25F|nr:contractile injection system tape measure protein [Mucilaginibacter sp. AK015]MBB5395237.1 hypothetical protein [Mucilaginibacter sp. AK015]
MRQREGHIVSTLSWDTTFDNRALGFDLQNRLSQWSRFVMPGELDYVFKAVCPEGMSLSIHSLEIDLGEIEVNELEAQLKRRLEATLREKLADMLSYPVPGQNLKLVKQTLASIESLRHFLINGTMPWNYSGGDINALVGVLFKEQPHQTIELLRETGTVYTATRKRMAWQFNEANYNATIRGFEPVSYDQINCLSAEMVRLQHKEQFVRSSVADLEKEIRLWILNYLLSDRGTIFNNLAFMKDILVQMAHRHNIAYCDLLLLIENAIVKPNLAFNVKGDFMTVINMLSEQQRHTAVSLPDNNLNLPDSTAARRKQVRAGNPSPAQFAAYIVNAGYPDSHSSLQALPVDVKYWLKNATGLDDHFMAVFFNACQYTLPCAVVKLVQLFTKLPGGIPPLAGRYKTRAICVAYLLKYRQQITIKTFLSYLLQQCANISGTTTTQVYNTLCRVIMASRFQGLSMADFAHLAAVPAGMNYIKNDKAPFAAIVYNLNTYTLQNAGDRTGRDFLRLLRADLKALIRLDEHRVLQLLRAYKNKAFLFGPLRLLTDNWSIDRLLRAGKGANFGVVTQFIKITGSDSVLAGSKDVAWLQRNVLTLALKSLILQPGLSAKLLAMQLAELAERSGRFTPEFVTWLRDQLSLEPLPAERRRQRRPTAARSGSNTETIELVNTLLLDENTAPDAVQEILQQYHFNHPVIQAIKQNTHLYRLLLNRLFSNGTQQVTRLVSTVLARICRTTPNVNKVSVQRTLTDLFWQCILATGWYRLGFRGFKKNFEAAVRYHYPGIVTGSDWVRVRGQIYGARHNFAGLANISHAALAKSLKTAIAAGADTLAGGHQSITFTDVLFQIMTGEGDPLKFSAGLALSDQEILRFMQKVDLEQVLYRLNISKPSLSQRIGDLAFIILLLDASGGGVDNEAAMMNVYRQALLFSSGQGSWQPALDKLLKQTVALLKTNAALSNKTAVKFNAAGFGISSNMRRSFISRASASQQKFIAKLNEAGLKVLKASGTELPLTTAGNLSPQAVKTLSKDVLRAHQTNVTEQLLYMVVTGQDVPTWFAPRPLYSAAMLAEEIVARHPLTLLNILKSERLTGQEYEQLAAVLPFQQLQYVLLVTNCGRSVIYELERVYNALGEMAFGAVTGRHIQMLLYRKLLLVIKSGNRSLISAGRIWQELIWDMQVNFNIPKSDFIRLAAKKANLLPPGYRAALGLIIAAGEAKALKDKFINTKPLTEMPIIQKPAGVTTEPVPVKNAGMVLLSEYIPALFRHMRMLNGQVFVNSEARLAAAHVLQYAVTGLTHTSEQYLPLNKVFCGLPLAEPVPEGITLTAGQKELISGMIRNMVSQWPVIGKTSVEGFRGNWLVRDGLLRETEERWELAVEPRPYDILINQFPFSFSIIKYQWMDKPLHVKWKI